MNNQELHNASHQEICDYYDRTNVTLSVLSGMTGYTVKELKKILTGEIK